MREPPEAEAEALTSAELRQRGAALAESGKWRRALHAFDAAIVVFPADEPARQGAELHEMRAQTLLALGEDFRAVQAATLACTLDGTWPEGFLTRGRAHVNMGELTLGLADLEEAAALGLADEAAEDLARAERLLVQNYVGAGGTLPVTLALQSWVAAARHRRVGSVRDR